MSDENNKVTDLDIKLAKERVENSFSRDSRGLLTSVQYKYKDDGSVDWRAMIRPEHLVIQKDKKDKVEQQYGKKVEELDLSTVEDKYILLLLSGIKEILRIRGFKHVQQHVDFVNHEKAVVTCSIQFTGNYETNYQDVVFSDVASATLQNTSGFGQHFLESIAANRAFVRAVRNFLGINIVGQDEIAGGRAVLEEDNSIVGETISAHSILQKKMDEKKFSFEQIKSNCAKNYKEKLTSNPEEWNGLKDIPQNDVFFILGKLSEKK